MLLAINFKEGKTNVILSLMKINSNAKQQTLNKKKTLRLCVDIKEFVLRS